MATAAAPAPPTSVWPDSLLLRWSAGCPDRSLYQYKELLGKGGFGEVYAATRQGVSTELVVKLIPGMRAVLGRHRWPELCPESSCPSRPGPHRPCRWSRPFAPSAHNAASHLQFPPDTVDDSFVGASSRPRAPGRSRCTRHQAKKVGWARWGCSGDLGGLWVVGGGGWRGLRPRPGQRSKDVERQMPQFKNIWKLEAPHSPTRWTISVARYFGWCGWGSAAGVRTYGFPCLAPKRSAHQPRMVGGGWGRTLATRI